MDQWDDYVYCKNCDRPRKEADSRINGSGYLTAYFCKSCNKRAAVAMTWNRQHLWLACYLPFIFWALVDCLNLYRSGFDKNDIPLVGPVIIFCLEGLRRANNAKFRAIYDRWVIKHGINPDKWPDAPKPE